MFTIDSEEVPVVTSHLPGVGGTLKEEPSDFQVEEVPLYKPSGEGEHVYLQIQHNDWATEELKQEIAELFEMPDYKIGYAGMKDKHALSTQFFSIHHHDLDPESAGERIEEALNCDVKTTSRHKNKLRRGHLIGNRFVIRLRDPSPSPSETTERVQEIVTYFEDRWFPNYYGPQRTGDTGRTMRGGRAIHRGNLELDRRWLRELYLSAYQSGLFNTWLLRRAQEDLLYQLVEGDIAKKRDTGGLFEVEDAQKEQPRMNDKDITYTGPIYGDDLWQATERAGEIESELAKEEELTDERLSALNLSGSRRRSLLYLDDLQYEMDDGDVVFRFSLPKGSYASMVLREFQ